MTNRNQPVKHPASKGAGTHVCWRVLHGGRPSCSMRSPGINCRVSQAVICQMYMSIQLYVSMPTGQRGRKGVRLASTPILVINNEPGNPYSRSFKGMGQPASDVTVWGRRSRSSRRAGKPSTWRRAPVVILFSDRITKHDMRNHHA
jgi:hypothetical protein